MTLRLSNVIRFVCFVSAFSFVFSSADAQRQIFLKPGGSSNKQPESSSLEKKDTQSRIFLTPGQSRSGLSGPSIFIPKKKTSVSSQRSVVFKNDLSVYQDGFKGLDPMKLTQAGDMPETPEEYKMIVAAHRAPRAKQQMEMEKNLDQFALREARPSVSSRSSTQSGDVYAPADFQRQENNKSGRQIYVKPKKSIWPLRLFGGRE